MVRPKRNTRQADLQEAIKDTAWKQIAQTGAAALSLRAIARELRITAPAIYNYFPRRDDLVMALIIDAYTSFGDSQLEARDALAADDLDGRLHAIGVAYRRWAITHPQRYQLIFGTPIPGYQAPAEQVFPAAARSLGVLVSVVDAFRAAGRLRVEAFPAVAPGYEAGFATWTRHAGDAHLISLSISMLIWSRVHGLVSLEIAGSIPPFGVDGDELYLYELQRVREQFTRSV